MKVGNTVSNTSADKWQGMGEISELKMNCQVAIGSGI